MGIKFNQEKKYCCCAFHFCISEFCSGSCQRERKTLNITACEPWFLPFSALRSKNSYSLYFVRSCLAVLICHIISASVSNESSSQTVHDQILFFCFFSALFFLSYKWLIYSVLGRQLFNSYLLPYFFYYMCIYMYACMHAQTFQWVLCWGI